ncbi:hypothetical protein [Streptomyces sp. NPDC005009]
MRRVLPSTTLTPRRHLADVVLGGIEAPTGSSADRPSEESRTTPGVNAGSGKAWNASPPYTGNGPGGVRCPMR